MNINSDNVNCMCFCGAGIETTDHYLLLCQSFGLVCLLSRIFEINVKFRNMNDLTQTS